MNIKLVKNTDKELIDYMDKNGIPFLSVSVDDYRQLMPKRYELDHDYFVCPNCNEKALFALKHNDGYFFVAGKCSNCNEWQSFTYHKNTEEIS